MKEKKIDEIKVRLFPHTKILFRAKAALEGFTGSQLLNAFVEFYCIDDISLYDFLEKIRNGKFVERLATQRRMKEILAIDEQTISMLAEDDAYKEFWDLAEDEFY